MFVYILQSLINGKHYYGSTKDVEKRIKLHNRGKVRSTKANRPYKLIYSEKSLPLRLKSALTSFN